MAGARQWCIQKDKNHNGWPRGTSIISPKGYLRYGQREVCVQRKENYCYGYEKRQNHISSLRAEIKILDKAVKSAPEEEKDGIKQIQKEKVICLRMKRRAESIRKNRRKFRKNCHDFLPQPYDFSRNLLSPKPKGCFKEYEKGSRGISARSSQRPQ